MGFEYNGGFVFVSSLLIISCGGQQTHLLKYINKGADPLPDAPPQFTSMATDIASWSNVRNAFSTADKMCALGLWALYNTTFFGEGAEDSTTVISVRGVNINACTNSGQMPILRNVQSVRFLGNADYSQNGMVIFSQAYLLGGMYTVMVIGDMVQDLPREIRGFPLGSIAITGNRAWIVCGDDDCRNAVCVDARRYGNLFLQRNVARDNSVAGGWPRIVRRVRIIDRDDCPSYRTPVPLNNTRIFRRDVSEKIEISVYETPSH